MRVAQGTPGAGFRFIDLFAGIGGLRLAFEAAGGRCVFTSEWDKYCRQTYEANFGISPHYAGDIRKVGISDIPPFDVLVAGFPCQPFSIAGVSKKNALGRPHGFDDSAQGDLFFRIAAILHERRPPAFLLENVRNLVAHDKGRTFQVILDTLQNELGYHVSYRVIDARGWLPQRRERIFIAGFSRGFGCDLDDMPVRSTDVGPTLEHVLHNCLEEADGAYVISRGKVNPKYTLSEHLWAYLQEYAAKHRRRGNGFGYGLVGPGDVARTLSARYYKDGSEILVEQRRRPPRRLTPRECARLMGFIRADGSPWRIVVSDTQAYKQFGNAVAVPVAKAVARYMAPYLERAAATRYDRRAPKASLV